MNAIQIDKCEKNSFAWGYSSAAKPNIKRESFPLSNKFLGGATHSFAQTSRKLPVQTNILCHSRWTHIQWAFMISWYRWRCQSGQRRAAGDGARVWMLLRRRWHNERGTGSRGLIFLAANEVLCERVQHHSLLRSSCDSAVQAIHLTLALSQLMTQIIDGLTPDVFLVWQGPCGEADIQNSRSSSDLNTVGVWNKVEWIYSLHSMFGI